MICSGQRTEVSCATAPGMKASKRRVIRVPSGPSAWNETLAETAKRSAVILPFEVYLELVGRLPSGISFRSQATPPVEI